LMIIALVCIAWSITALMIISAKVSRSGTRVNFFLITLLFFRYLSVYEDLTRKETGKTGPLIYHFVIPLWIALILVIIWILHSVAT
jgi:FtsH-binding integral membrane protein